MADDLAARIRSGILCFCAGDALGVPWEGRRPEGVDAGLLDELPARDGWPPGATSDDTAQLLLLADTLACGGDPIAFLERLGAALPGMRGVGPTSEAAIAGFAASGQPAPGAEPTNGAVMRAPALGWVGADRNAIGVFTRATHAAPEALEAARAVATMADAALVRGRLPARRRGWLPPPAGVSLNALETVAAVRYVVSTHDDPATAMRAAVMLGGDTDTVAALVGGILGCRDPGAWRYVPWLARVQVPLEVDELAVRLAAVRGRAGSAPARARRRRGS